MKASFIFLFGLLVSFEFAFAATEKYQLQSNKGKIEFMAIGKPAMIRIKGEGHGPEGMVEINGTQVTGLVVVDVQSLNTGIELRDKHMKEKYLETQTQPKAELQIERLLLPSAVASLQGQKLNLPFTGTLKLHGVSSKVEGKIDLSFQGKSAQGSAQFPLKITDYQINIPTYAGIKVAEQVDVQVQFEATLQ